MPLRGMAWLKVFNRHSTHFKASLRKSTQTYQAGLGPWGAQQQAHRRETKGMNARKSVELSRGFLLGVFAVVVWSSLGVAVFQFLGGGYGLGFLFLVVGLACLLIAAEGSILRRLAGRRMSVINLYTALGVFALVGANEIWGLLGLSGTSTARLSLELVFALVLIVLLLVTLRQAFLLIRRGRQV